MDGIWKIGQETKAEDFYNQIEKCGGAIKAQRKENAVKIMNEVCQQMIQTYNQVVADENNYLIDAEDVEANTISITDEIQEKIKKLEAEIKELQQKEKNGTITEEEKKELINKKDELSNLRSEVDNNVSKKEDDLSSIANKAKETRNKDDIAEDYGNIAVKKGSELAGTGDSVGTLGKVLSFGLWSDHSAQRIGEATTKSGNELLELVGDAKNINDNIDKKVTKK